MPPRYSPLQKEKLDFHKKCEEKNMLQLNELMTQYNNIQTNKQIIKESNRFTHYLNYVVKMPYAEQAELYR